MFICTNGFNFRELSVEFYNELSDAFDSAFNRDCTEEWCYSIMHNFDIAYCAF